MAVERIDSDLCIGCALCYDACSTDVIRMDEQSRKAVVEYPEDCVLCAWCIASCPVNAVVFTAARTAPLMSSWG
jgi:NAD-dependent dihydropyrimidine dehydrogenase PreA subunit